jgi:hypothetical protein
LLAEVPLLEEALLRALWAVQEPLAVLLEAPAC